ncbi:hypothetical protein CBR_g4511 [Chara braunii]|uniref:DDE Tnp4 domain-containing protein n=1 Tax=Chara braunii TaxID=69332 RepID=A0A388KI04_CHABU|nr:hypothetical protein CBR_g4511 [Chara braunii]|eukprot:GBG69681.1 hypothetical protein CBR_g4511 [Chara braunii]
MLCASLRAPSPSTCTPYSRVFTTRHCCCSHRSRAFFTWRGRAMDVDGDAVHDTLSKAERAAVAAAVNMILIRCQQRTEGRMRAAIRARRKKTLQSIHVDEEGGGAICDAVLQVCYAMGCGAFPRATPRWWMKRRTGGVWEDLRQCDDSTEDYFKDKLHMSPRVFQEIAETLSSFLQRRVKFYREPLQPDLIVAFALYRWASRETYESGTCSFGIGRKSGLVAVRDVTSALLSAYRDKILWPTGLQKAVVLHAFTDKGFPNCHGCIDCTHIFIDKPANCLGEDYYDRKRRFSVQAQVVADLNLHVLDVFVGYPGSCHDVRIVHLSSLWARAEAGELFTGPPVMLPFGVRTNSYLLGDNGYPPSEWVVVPYGGVSQHPSEIRFDNKQKTARGAVERAFGRLKGMWRLFLHSHKTNMETLPQQFVAVCILHNILIDAGIPFDDNLLWEVGPDGVRRKVDLGMHRPLRQMCMEASTGDALILRDALAERMGVKACDVMGEGDDDDALVNRLRQRNTREGMEAAAKLWVDDLSFWNEREGFAIVKLIAEARGYLVAVARGEQPPPIRRSIVLPHNSIPQHKIADESELNAAKERALKVQRIALWVIHGWVFKSQNRQRGYHAAYQYALNHAATDIARAMWMGEDWRYGSTKGSS